MRPGAGECSPAVPQPLFSVRTGYSPARLCTFENAVGNKFDAVIEDTVGGTGADPKIKTSTITTTDGETIDYFS